VNKHERTTELRASTARRLATTFAVTAAVAGLGTATIPRPAAAAPPTSPPLAAAPTFLASIFVGNADDDQFSGVVDVLTLGQEPGGFPSGVDEDDAMAVGDLVGDSGDEVVIAGDDEGRVDVHDGRTGELLDRLTLPFNKEEDGLAVGNVLGDPKDEFIVADEGLSTVAIVTAAHQSVRFLLHMGFDSTDTLLAADTTGDGFDEIIVANDEDDGRVDVFDQFGNLVDQVHTGFDGDDAVAAGEVTRDAFADIVVANTEDTGRVDSYDLANDVVYTIHTGYDSDDKLAVGNVTASPVDEIVIANTEDHGRVDIYDFDQDEPITIDSGYDGDDRFAVGTFGDGDVDADQIPDRVELYGIHDVNHQMLLNLPGTFDGHPGGSQDRTCDVPRAQPLLIGRPSRYEGRLKVEAEIGVADHVRRGGGRRSWA
jgi:hypothetical protein